MEKQFLDSTKLTKSDLHESVFYILDGRKNNICVITFFDESENIYKIGESNRELLKAFFDKEGYFLEFYKCSLIKTKNKVYYKNIKKIKCKFSEFLTIEHRKKIVRERNRQKNISLAINRMHKIFSKNFYVRCFSKNGNIVLFIKVLDAFFIGSDNYIQVDKRIFSGKFFHIDKKWLLYNMKYNKKFRKHMFDVQEMLKNFVEAKKLSKFSFMILYNVLFTNKKSSLYNIVKNYKEKLKGAKKND